MKGDNEYQTSLFILQYTRYPELHAFHIYFVLLIVIFCLSLQIMLLVYSSAPHANVHPLILQCIIGYIKVHKIHKVHNIES